MGLRSWIRSYVFPSHAATEARLAEIERRLSALSVEEARRLAEATLAQRDVFLVERSAPSIQEIDGLQRLPPVAREFFETYARIESAGMQLDRRCIAPFDRGRDYLRIGADIDHADVILNIATDHVSVVEDDGRDSPNLEETHTSIWHYLLYLDENLKPGP